MNRTEEIVYELPIINLDTQAVNEIFPDLLEDLACHKRIEIDYIALRATFIFRMNVKDMITGLSFDKPIESKILSMNEKETYDIVVEEYNTNPKYKKNEDFMNMAKNMLKKFLLIGQVFRDYHDNKINLNFKDEDIVPVTIEVPVLVTDILSAMPTFPENKQKIILTKV